MPREYYDYELNHTVIYDSYGDALVREDAQYEIAVINDRFVFDLDSLKNQIFIYARHGGYDDKHFKEVSFHADKDKVNDLITVLTYWRDNVAKD